MPKTKSLPVDERITNAEEEIRKNKALLKTLLNEQKAEERKKRTHRICTRGGLLEGLLPDTITLNDERFKAFLEKTTANKFGRNILAELVAEQKQEDAANSAAAETQDGEEPAAENEGTAQGGGKSNASQPAQTAEPPSGTDEGKTGDGARSGS